MFPLMINSLLERPKAFFKVAWNTFFFHPKPLIQATSINEAGNLPRHVLVSVDLYVCKYVCISI